MALTFSHSHGPDGAGIAGSSWNRMHRISFCFSFISASGSSFLECGPKPDPGPALAGHPGVPKDANERPVNEFRSLKELDTSSGSLSARRMPVLVPDRCALETVGSVSGMMDFDSTFLLIVGFGFIDSIFLMILAS